MVAAVEFCTLISSSIGSCGCGYSVPVLAISRPPGCFNRDHEAISPAAFPAKAVEPEGMEEKEGRKRKKKVRKKKEVL